MKLASDYHYEQARSLLFSWDNKRVITTNAYNELRKRLNKTGIKKWNISNMMMNC